MGVATVSKKKRQESQGEEQRDALIAVRCRPSFKRWLEGFSRQERITPSQLVELGLVSLARERGYEEPPER